MTCIAVFPRDEFSDETKRNIR